MGGRRRPVGGLAPAPGTGDPTSLCTSQPLSLASSSWATQVRGISGEEMRFAVNLLEIASLDQLSTNLHSDPLGGSAPSSVPPPQPSPPPATFHNSKGLLGQVSPTTGEEGARIHTIPNLPARGQCRAGPPGFLPWIYIYLLLIPS